MSTQPVIIEQLLDAAPQTVWSALTDVEIMKNWYFHLHEFKAEVGFQFQFTGGNEEGIKYLHICEVTEADPPTKLTYSWRYDGYDGVSYVTFDLFPQDQNTLLRLTHSGLETFPADNLDFATANFQKGWDEIIRVSLKNYLHSFFGQASR